jgi:hypothetical protein
VGTRARAHAHEPRAVSAGHPTRCWRCTGTHREGLWAGRRAAGPGRSACPGVGVRGNAAACCSRQAGLTGMKTLRFRLPLFERSGESPDLSNGETDVCGRVGGAAGGGTPGGGAPGRRWGCAAMQPAGANAWASPGSDLGRMSCRLASFRLFDKNYKNYKKCIIITCISMMMIFRLSHFQKIRVRPLERPTVDAHGVRKIPTAVSSLLKA